VQIFGYHPSNKIDSCPIPDTINIIKSILEHMNDTKNLISSQNQSSQSNNLTFYRILLRFQKSHTKILIKV